MMQGDMVHIQLRRIKERMAGVYPLLQHTLQYKKGYTIGETSVYAQQVTLLELEAKKKNIKPRANYCPRKDAIKELSNLIASLQEKEL
jgi:hypothetical protein